MCNSPHPMRIVIMTISLKAFDIYISENNVKDTFGIEQLKNSSTKSLEGRKLTIISYRQIIVIP